MTRWPTKALGELVDFIGGGTPRRDRPDYWDGDIPWASVKDLQSQSLETTLENVTTAGLTNSASNLIPQGTVIIASRVGLGKVAINRKPVAINQDLKALMLRSSDLLPRYLLLFLLSKAEYFEQAGVGATVKGLTIADYRKLCIALPPLAEQERIVKLLDEADELRKLRAQADRRTTDLISALFNEMFGDPTHLEMMRWSFKPLGEFAKVSYGLADKLDATTKPENGTRILTISNVLLHGSIDTRVEKYSVVEPAERAKARLQHFDLLFNWRNGSEEHVGKTAIWEKQVEGEILHVSFLLKIRADLDQANPYFLWALINRLRATGYFTRNARMQINRKFNASELSALKLPLPPLELQKEFAARVSEIRAMQAEQAASRHRLDDLFQSMLHRAFNGEL